MEAVATVAGCRAFFSHLSAFALIAISALPATVSASWLATGPYGGDADIVRAVPDAKGQVIAAARNGLIFSSVNGAASWINLPFPAQFSGVLHALEVDPKVPKTWYAGVESEMSRVSGIYKTVDAGATWTQLPGTEGIGVWSLAIWTGDDRVIAAGTSTGVFLTSDAGTAWKKISPAGDTEIRPVVSLAFHPGDSKILYAGTTHLPWKTSDGGGSWESIHTGMLDDSDVFSIQVDAKNPEHVMASACSGVYNSVDGAKHWTKLDTPTGAFRTHFVALDPRHEGVVFAGTTDGLLKSANGGHLWRKVSPSSVRALAFDSGLDGRIFFAASGGTTQGGLMVSTDEGSTLHESNTGFTNRNFTTLSGAGLSLYSFGDPDFFNGPAHAISIVEALHREFPQVTYDVTIKIEHLRKHDALLPVLRDTGCLFVTSAVESVDDAVLEKFDKGHTRADFFAVVARFRALGMTLLPTFVPFTPWTMFEGYSDLLDVLAAEGLTENVAPIQLAIRLLIPAGSRLLELPEVRDMVGPFDSAALVFPWKHADESVDALAREISQLVQRGEGLKLSRTQIFSHIRRAANGAAGNHAPHGTAPPETKSAPVPYLDEPWYCCAEPMDDQFVSIGQTKETVAKAAQFV